MYTHPQQEIFDRIDSMTRKTDIDLSAFVEYQPSLDRVIVWEPDEVVSVWAVLSLQAEGLLCMKDWIDGAEIMTITLRRT